MKHPDATEMEAAAARIKARVERLNRVTYLAGLLDAAELDGFITFAEVAVRPDGRGALRDMTKKKAVDGLSFMLPLEDW